MMVSANKASCVPAEPMVAGTSALKKRRTSSSSRSARNQVATPARQRIAADQHRLQHA